MKALTLRTRTSMGLCLAVWVIAAIGLGSMVAQGYWTELLRYGTFFLVAGWGAWMLFGAPAVRIDDDAVTLDNVVRAVHIPWDQVDDVEAGLSLRIRTPSGAFSSWAAPGGSDTAPSAAFGAEEQLGVGSVAAVQIARASDQQQMDTILGIDRSGLSSASSIRAAIEQAWRAYGAVNALIADPGVVRRRWHTTRLAVLGGLVVLAVVAALV
jgi:hypothetical protein